MSNSNISLKGSDAERKNLINKERLKYLKGEGMSYNWDTVKKAALDKRLREGLLQVRVQPTPGF